MRILKLRFIESPEFDEQYTRSYNSNLTHQNLEDAVRDSYDEGISLVGMARSTTNIITPTGRSFVSNIEGGWNNKRIKFAMLVEVAVERYTTEIAYIVGYTDRSDYLQDGDLIRFDPRMELHFNSITYVTNRMMDYGGGDVYQPSIRSSDQILRKGVFDRHESYRSTMRPSDLFKRMYISGKANDMLGRTSGATNSYHSLLRNTTGQLTQEMALSRRDNNVASSYLFRSVRDYMASANEQTDIGLAEYQTDEYDEEEVLHGSSERLKERFLSSDTVMDFYRDVNIMDKGYITYEDLLDMNPDFNEDLDLGFRPTHSDERFRYRDLDSMRSDNVESIAAAVVAQSLPSIMVNSMYSRIEGMVINSAARLGEDVVTVGIPYPFVDGLSTTANLPYFRDMMENVVLRDMTRNGAFHIDALINADMDDVTEIWIRVDGGPEEHFVFPCFADSLLAPTYSSSERDIDRMANDIVTLSSAFNLEHDRFNDNNPPVTHSRGW